MWSDYNQITSLLIAGCTKKKCSAVYQWADMEGFFFLFEDSMSEWERDRERVINDTNKSNRTQPPHVLDYYANKKKTRNGISRSHLHNCESPSSDVMENGAFCIANHFTSFAYILCLIHRVHSYIQIVFFFWNEWTPSWIYLWYANTSKGKNPKSLTKRATKWMREREPTNWIDKSVSKTFPIYSKIFIFFLYV